MYTYDRQIFGDLFADRWCIFVERSRAAWTAALEGEVITGRQAYAQRERERERESE